METPTSQDLTILARSGARKGLISGIRRPESAGWWARSANPAHVVDVTRGRTGGPWRGRNAPPGRQSVRQEPAAACAATWLAVSSVPYTAAYRIEPVKYGLFVEPGHPLTTS
jgi:hypothetical protein